MDGTAPSDSQEGEEYGSPHEVYKRLIQVVINESLAPEVLPFEEAVVEVIVDQVQHMSGTIKKLASRLGSFCTEQHKIELERFSYVVNKYYRTRLEKVEAHAQSLVTLLRTDRGRASKLLSRQEIKYLDNYVSSIDEHIKGVLLDRMPPNMRAFKISEVPLDQRLAFETQYVFVKASRETSVLIDDPITGQEVVQLEKGSQNFLPYSAVRPHLQSGSKDLLLL